MQLWRNREGQGSITEGKIKVVNKHAAGDCTVLAFALAALQREQPNLKIEVGCCIPDLFQENWKSTQDRRKGFNPSVPFKATADKGIAYPVMMTKSLGDQLGIDIPFTYKPPIFRLTEEEHKPIFDHPYLVLNSGRKAHDGDCKFFGTHNWQAVVDGLKEHFPIIQVGSASDVHPLLSGTINHISKTTVRQLLSLVSHKNCLGVLSQITFVYWLAVAQGKQTYTVCNAREHPDFLRVNKNSRFYFSEKGTYECPLNSCFKIRTYKHKDRDWRDKHLCLAPKKVGLEVLPACALAIDPQWLIDDIKTDLIHWNVL